MEKILILLSFLCVMPLFGVKSLYEIRSEQVIRQNYEESCGAASLATLINLIDSNHLDEKTVLEIFDHNTNQVSFLDLQKAALTLGYQAKSYKISREVFNKIDIPVIVKIENDPKFPHFVVIFNHQGDFISVFDPSFGQYTSSKQQFYSVWDKNQQGGFVLIILPVKVKNISLILPPRVLMQK